MMHQAARRSSFAPRRAPLSDPPVALARRPRTQRNATQRNRTWILAGDLSGPIRIINGMYISCHRRDTSFHSHGPPCPCIARRPWLTRDQRWRHATPTHAWCDRRGTYGSNTWNTVSIYWRSVCSLVIFCVDGVTKYRSTNFVSCSANGFCGW